MSISPELVGVIGMVTLIIILLSGMWIGFAMGFIGFVGFAYLGGVEPAFKVLATVPYSVLSDYTFPVIPLFILMGIVVSNSRIGEDVYRAGYTWLGQFSGGLAVATSVACAAFAAICGTSTAGTVTIGKVAVPEMKKYNYDDSLSTACVAAGGTLGILIPPSIGFVLYALLTEESVGKLFMAGILPGILLTALFILSIVATAWRNPRTAPPGPRTSFKQKRASLRYCWATLCLFLLVLGGIYGGIFTPTEAGAIGAFGAIVIGTATRRINCQNFLNSLWETAQHTGMIVAVIIGAFIFMRFLAISKLPFAMAEIIRGLDLPRYAIFAVIIFIYIILGMFLDIFAAIILTVPIIFPTILALGFDPLWYGVIMVIMIEMGLITPPVGLNVFVLSGVTGIPVGTIFRGVWPFVVSMLVGVIILTIFPEIALFLPNIM